MYLTIKRGVLARMEGQLGEYHAGELRRQSSEAEAERIIAEELPRLGWREEDPVVYHTAGRWECAGRLAAGSDAQAVAKLRRFRACGGR